MGRPWPDDPEWRTEPPTVDEVKAGKNWWFTCNRGDPYSVTFVKLVVVEEDGVLWCLATPPEVPS